MVLFAAIKVFGIKKKYVNRETNHLDHFIFQYYILNFW